MEDNRVEVNLGLLMGYAESPADMKGFIEVFIRESEGSLVLLSENCTEGECKTWVEAAHKFKGGSGMVGATKLHKLCEQGQAMQDVSAAERESALQEIKHEYGRVKKYLLGQI